MGELIKSWADLRDFLNRQTQRGDSRLDGPIMVEWEDGTIEPCALLETPIEEIGSDDELLICPLTIIEGV